MRAAWVNANDKNRPFCVREERYNCLKSFTAISAKLISKLLYFNRPKEIFWFSVIAKFFVRIGAWNEHELVAINGLTKRFLAVPP